ncbi:hypothetical protein BE221DRAFT_79517 [Ostreococcus tauri]|uniref:Uncharacterized protein n=1 Tax=Ostreococcus tauri TaxID=70448 RepID=A0A1Y5I3D2_OSTTA|nr:hypothetical protein BE221DRAFT_79517 [Ostreococcus tauri]
MYLRHRRVVPQCISKHRLHVHTKRIERSVKSIGRVMMEKYPGAISSVTGYAKTCVLSNFCNLFSASSSFFFDAAGSSFTVGGSIDTFCPPTTGAPSVLESSSPPLALVDGRSPSSLAFAPPITICSKNAARGATPRLNPACPTRSRPTVVPSPEDLASPPAPRSPPSRTSSSRRAIFARNSAIRASSPDPLSLRARFTLDSFSPRPPSARVVFALSLVVVVGRFSVNFNRSGAAALPPPTRAPAFVPAFGSAGSIVVARARRAIDARAASTCAAPRGARAASG